MLPKLGLDQKLSTLETILTLVKVISGQYPVVETWEDSTYYIGEPKRYKFMQNEMGARKKIIVGQFYKGCLESDIQGLEIGSNESSGVMMTNLQEHQSLVLYTTAKLEKEDIFKLWTVMRFDCLDNWGITPDIDINGLLDRNRIQYLYISKKHLYLDPSNGRDCYTGIEFESLNDRLSDTGYSIANYVQPALAGVGYARPRFKLVPEHEIPLPQRHDSQPNPNLILNAKRSPARYHFTVRGVKYYAAVVLDPWKVIDVGVWGCQVKIDNTAIIHSVRLMGYPIPYDADLHKDPDHPEVYNQGYVFAPPDPSFLSTSCPLSTRLWISNSKRKKLSISWWASSRL